jgi:Transposase DDE domain./Transposase domain (DUF772).
MRIHIRQPLFAWNALEDSPSIRTIRDFLQAVPDHDLLAGLEQQRGRGRDDYPVRVLWGVVILTILLRHVSINACLDELRRNRDLRMLLNMPEEDQVPKAWNMSRFLEVLGQEPHLTALRGIFDQLVRRLGQAVPDLGKDTAGDATALKARRPQEERAADDGLPQPSGGRKEYRDDDGQVTKVIEWFGYKLHLLVDTRHEVALAYHLTAPSSGDGERVPALLEQASGNLPANRLQTMAFDKAADDQSVHECLHEYKIKPLIQMRALWKEEPERRPEGTRLPLNVVHDEAGTFYCYDTTGEAPVRHPMSYYGYEADRGTLKYRCPARHEGWDCPSDAKCNAGKKAGLSVRIPSALDRRRFPPIPRATQTFERMYKGRTAVERVNARLKIFWGADDGNVIGAARFHALVGAVMVVHLGLATLLAATPRWEGTLGQTRYSPIAKRLAAEIAAA